jgi:hypothetical protein
MTTLTLKTKHNTHVVTFDGEQLLFEKGARTPIERIPNAWAVIMGSKSIPAREYFAEAIIAAEERLRLAAIRAEAERLAMFGGLPGIIAVTVNGAVANLKWHDKQWWLASPDKITPLTRQVAVAIDGRPILYRNLVDRLERRCPEFRALVMQRRAQRKAAAARHKREREARNPALYIGSNELIERGWTRHQIHKYIGKPDRIKRGIARQFGKRYLWLRMRTDQLSPKPPRPIQPPQAVDLLAAIFAVNRSAKRFRDAAQRCYVRFAHNCARIARNKKEKLYSLKDRGIAAAYRAGKLHYCGMHARLATYMGDGYRFHSRLQPFEATADDAPFLLVEAKPKTAREARLMDAEYTLAHVPLDLTGFGILDSPHFSARPKQYTAVDGDEYEDEYDRA